MVWRLTCLLGFLALGTGISRALPPPVDAGQQLWTFLRQHGYGVLKIDHQVMNSQFIAVEINGRHCVMLVDTGSDRTRLSHDCAADLDLDIHDTGKASISMGGFLKGNEGVATVNSFKLTGYEINRTSTVQVNPKGALLKDSDGLFGYDFLHANNMILPVGAGFIFFKPGKGPAADSASYLKRMGFKSIPLQHVPAGLKVVGHMNGVPLSAIVDCGASFSVFSLKFVFQTKTSTRAIGNGPRGVDGRSEPTYVFTPSSVDFGSFVFPPEPMLSQLSPGIMATGTQAVLGYDLLAEHNAIIDLGQSVLWMK